MVPASINADPNTIAISQEIDNEEKNTWVAEPVLEYPEWDYECFHCGKETEEHEGYLRDGECYCDACAYDLFDQPMPKSKYTDEMWANFHKTCQASKEEELSCYDCGVTIGETEGCFSDGQRICDRCNYELTVSERPSAYYFDENNEKFDKMAQVNQEEDVWDELAKIVLGEKELEPEHVYKPISRSYCDDHLDTARHLSRDYHHGLEYGIPEPVRNLPDQLPGSVEELYKFLDKQLEKSIIPDDAILIDNDYVYCKTYDEVKEILKRASFRETDVIQDLPDSYIISQNNSTFWFELSQDIKVPNKFIICVYAPKDAVAKKYLRRMLEDCVYHMDYLINPEAYQHNEEDDDEDCATEEDEANFYREQAANQIAEEQNDMAQNDIDVEIEIDNYDTYYTKKALCVTCGEVNYAEPICETEGHSRMVCCDCIEIVNCCKECNHLSLEYVYDSPNCDGVRVANGDLCFDCKFKKPLREQMPLEVHMSIRSDIQVLTRQQFDILADYAELCEFTIFDAYRYKSRCHYYDCDRMVEPGKWNAEKAVQFCCRRHEDIADHIGCHFQNVYDGSDYDEDWEQAVCKVCNNCNHDTNMIPRIALRESDQGVQPIISVIRMFEELGINNLLFENLVDLCEYF